MTTSRQGHVYLSLVSVVCCQVGVSATGWPLVQRRVLSTVVGRCVWPRHVIHEVIVPRRTAAPQEKTYHMKIGAKPTVDVSCSPNTIKWHFPDAHFGITSLWRNYYTGCNRRNGPDFGRVFLMLNYTGKPQNTYIQSWTVTEIMASEVWNFDSCYTLIDYQIRIETDRNMWFL